jgi:hypothetical protein
MANYDANYNPSADPAFDEAPFTGEENAEENAVDVVDADTSAAKMTAQEDRDAERTDSHGQPSKCTRASMTYSEITNEGLFAVEVDSLLSDVREDERGVSGGTRGKKVDAYKQERALDRATGLAGDEE